LSDLDRQLDAGKKGDRPLREKLSKNAEKSVFLMAVIAGVPANRGHTADGDMLEVVTSTASSRDFLCCGACRSRCKRFFPARPSIWTSIPIQFLVARTSPAGGH
jgi:hypothetical protein